jgi:hypothetical protein
MTKNTFFFAFMLLFAGVASAQEIRISGHQVVASDSTWTVHAGTTVVFGPNASVEVLGGLEFQGTVDMPIRITSLDPYEGTGLGFLINGQSNTYINLNNIIVNNLQTPFRFDPFWYRSRATLSNVQFYENNQEFKRNAPIVSVGVPFLRLEQPATLNLTGLYFANNHGGVVIDGLGQNGANYFLNGLAFEYNYGFEQYNTPLHLELSGNATNYTVSNLLFNQNENYGLSVGGIDGTITIENIYLNTRESATNVIDKNTNYRLPLVEGDRLDLASNPTASGFVTQSLFLDQEPGTVIVERAQGATSVPTMLFDADGSAIEFTSIETDRGLELSYTQGLPASAVFGNGTFAWVKPLAVEELPEPVYDFSEKGLGSGFSEMLDETGISDWTAKKMNQLLHPKNKPGFEESWEVGGTFGGTLYDSRDLKMIKFSTQDISGLLPNIGMLWPGGAIGYTGGTFLQHNKNSYVSYKASINAMNVNAGKVRSLPYRFTDAPVINRTITNRGQILSHGHRFSTSIQTLELELSRHFVSNQLREDQKSKWIPSWDFGLGALHFTPYAVQSISTTDQPYTWYLFTTRDEHVNLRRVGTAGQNNMPNMSRYRSFALMASTGFKLSYLRRSWRLSGQIKGNLTTTDYLDDFSRGTYFGGDYDGWLETLDDYTYTDPLTGEEKPFSINRLAIANRYGGSRAQNYMPDGFWQIQFTLSKNIDGPPLKSYYDPLVSAYSDKLTSWWVAKRGEKRIEKVWEAGSWAGAAFYGGRDLKYKKIAGIVPVPTNIEMSRGLYIQKNTHKRYSVNLGIHAANMSYARTQTPLQIFSARNIQSYQNSPNTPVVRVEPKAFNFFTQTSSIESNMYYHFRDYDIPEGKKLWIVPSIGLGLGIMNYTPYREVRGLNVGDPAFLMWKRKKTQYIDLRQVGSEGQHILPNGRAYGKWAGLYNASFQLSAHTAKWIYKVEVKSNMTTTDYLDDFGRGAWFGGDYTLWGEALDVSYFNENLGEQVPLSPEQIAEIPEDFNLFTPRATNNLMDGYLQFHIGIAKKL